MKTKTKLVVSICALTLIFSACTKDAPLPAPFLDCMEIENGTAINDNCGDCHKWTVYNYVTHAVREVNDTTNEVLLENEMFASPNNPMNLLWNASCTDCDGILNGVSAIDSCGDCQGAFLYNFTTHNPMDIVMLGGDTTGAASANAATTDSIICVLPEHPMNSYWNSGCK